MRKQIERALARAVTCRTKHGTFRLGPAAKLVEIDLETDYSHDERPRSRLRLGEGSFYTRALDLVTHSSDYAATGVLVWLPALDQLASWDHDHQDLFVFPDTRIADVLADPEPFLTTQWERGCGDSATHLEKHFDFVPRDLDKLVFAAFDGGPRTRTKAIARWASLIARYPSLAARLDVHGRAVDLHNQIVDGDHDAADTQLAELNTFFRALSPTTSLAELDETRVMLTSHRLARRIEDVGESRSVEDLLTLVPAFPSLEAHAYDTLLAHFHNILGEQISAGRLAEGNRLLDAYLRLPKRGGNPDVQEGVASHGVCIAVLTRDATLFARLRPLVPRTVRVAVLAFNLACYHAVTRNKRAMLRYIKEARDLGKQRSEFVSEADFAAYLDDPAFVALTSQ